MAQTATIYNFETEIADVDRGVYQTLSLRVARQPSETMDFMVTRLLAYCLEYGEGIEFTAGVAAVDEPAVIIRDLTGRLTGWIEVGMPSAERVHRGAKRADRVAIYTHRSLAQVLAVERPADSSRRRDSRLLLPRWFHRGSRGYRRSPRNSDRVGNRAPDLLGRDRPELSITDRRAPTQLTAPPAPSRPRTRHESFLIAVFEKVPGPTGVAASGQPSEAAILTAMRLHLASSRRLSQGRHTRR
jgi:uncharacterized protein YaeQ